MPPVSTTKARRITSASTAQPDYTMASPGRQTSGMAGHKNTCGWVRWAGVWHPVDLPEGYHTTTQGQSLAHVPVPSRAAPGPPCGRALPGSSYVCVKGFGVVSSSGFDGHGLEWVHQPRCARLRRFRVDPGHSRVRSRSSKSPTTARMASDVGNVADSGMIG
jgi:hypothetical protein